MPVDQTIQMMKNSARSTIVRSRYIRTYIHTDAAPASGCVCPGDTLTYECTTMGTDTAWFGTAFNCLGGHSILLRHSTFLDRRAYGSCNDGSIVARGISIEGNHYTSQLNVTVTPDIAGTTIVCYNLNGVAYGIVLSFVIPTTGLF